MSHVAEEPHLQSRFFTVDMYIDCPPIGNLKVKFNMIFVKQGIDTLTTTIYFLLFLAWCNH